MTGQVSPPKALDAEAAVLGAILLEGSVIYRVIGELSPEDFFSEKNQLIYAAMLRLAEAGTPITVTALCGALEGQLNAAEIVEGTDSVPDYQHVESYAAIVKQKSMLRSMQLIASEALAAASAPRADALEVIGNAEGAIFRLAERAERKQFVALSTAAGQVIDGLEKAHSGGKREGVIPTGFYTLDEMTGGMHAGDLVLLAGRPGMGKTAFALSISVNMARHGAHVGILSLESSTESLVLRMLCAETGISLGAARKCQMGRDDFAKLAASSAVTDAPIWIDDQSNLNVLEVRSKARRLSREKGLDVLFLDYIQIMRPIRHEKGRSRNDELGEMSRGLKSIAKELQIPVVALAQLNRDLEKNRGKDKRPQLSDLRESGNLEQDADLVLMLYREDYYSKPEQIRNGIAEVLIKKQREGPTGGFKLFFDEAHVKFSNLSKEEYHG